MLANAEPHHAHVAWDFDGVGSSLVSLMVGISCPVPWPVGGLPT